MGKITYWLRKLGILRTSGYTAKNMEELNEVTATNGGVMQSQKEIDEKYKPKENTENEQSVDNNQNNSESNTGNDTNNVGDATGNTGNDIDSQSVDNEW